MIDKAATLGEYLKITRTRHGYSLQRVEDLTGLEASTIKRIEDGTHATPSPETLLALADALGLPVGALAEFIDLETDTMRVWLARTGTADSEPFNKRITIEELREGHWVTVEEYPG